MIPRAQNRRPPDLVAPRFYRTPGRSEAAGSLHTASYNFFLATRLPGWYILVNLRLPAVTGSAPPQPVQQTRVSSRLTYCCSIPRAVPEVLSAFAANSSIVDNCKLASAELLRVLA